MKNQLIAYDENGVEHNVLIYSFARDEDANKFWSVIKEKSSPWEIRSICKLVFPIMLEYDGTVENNEKLDKLFSEIYSQ